MKRSLTLSALGLLAITLAAAPRADAQSYTYVDLGNLGNVSLIAINNSGQILGQSGSGYAIRTFVITPLDTNGDGQPDTWYQDANNDGVNDLMTVLPLPSGYTGNMPHAINSFGQVAGETRLNAFNQVTQLATIGSPGGPTEVVTSTHSAAFGVNDNGILTGWAYNTVKGYTDLYPATWQKTVTRKGTAWSQILLTTPAPYAAGLGWAVNNDGAVSGRLWTQGQGSIVPAVYLPAPLYGRPQGWTVLPSIANMGGDPKFINVKGQMAGTSDAHAALWLLQPAYGLPAGVQDLNPVGTIFMNSEALGMNNAPNGVLSVVGEMNDQVSVESAFVWRSDTRQAIDLNTVTTGRNAGWVLWSAVGVNDSGLILGYSLQAGSGGQGPSRYFVLVPNP